MCISRAVSCPHSVVSEAVAWCKLFGQNEIIHLQHLEHSPRGNQIDRFKWSNQIFTRQKRLIECPMV